MLGQHHSLHMKRYIIVIFNGKIMEADIFTLERVNVLLQEACQRKGKSKRMTVFLCFFKVNVYFMLYILIVKTSQPSKAVN